MFYKKAFLLNLSFVMLLASFESYGDVLSKSPNVISNVVSQNEAIKIAEGFIDARKQDFQGGWNNIVELHSQELFGKNNQLKAYEIQVFFAGKPQGSIIVNSSKNDDVISSFSTNGVSFTKALDDFYIKELVGKFNAKGLVVQDKKIFSMGDTSYALGVKFQRGVSWLKSFENIHGYYIFSPYPQNDLSLDTTQKSAVLNTITLEENNEFRNGLIKKDFSGSLFFRERFAKIDGELINIANSDNQISASIGINGGLYGFQQELSAWTKGGLTNGLCYAGCTPVAWATVLEYGDRYGFPNLVGTNQNNNHPDYRHADVRWMINELRGWLKTTCTTDRSGSTAYWNATRGEYYAQSRGYTTYHAYNSYSDHWGSLVNAINNSLPPVTAVTESLGGHSVVTYAYDDFTGDQNDFFLAKTGWGNPTDRWYHKSKLTGVTTIYPR